MGGRRRTELRYVLHGITLHDIYSDPTANETLIELLSSVPLSLALGIWGVIAVSDARDCMDDSGYLFVIGLISAVLELAICGMYMLVVLIICAVGVSGYCNATHVRTGLRRDDGSLPEGRFECI